MTGLVKRDLDLPGRAIRLVVPFVLFGLGIAIGFACWNKIILPYHNPWHVVGPVMVTEYNPSNNLVRFLFLLSMPVVLLLISYLACPGKLRDRIFRPADPQIAGTKGRMRHLLLIALVLLATLAAINSPTEVAWGPLDTLHEGESLGASVSYMHGQAPYKDFVVPHGMGQDPLRSVVAFKLFGRSIGAVRTLYSILKILDFILLGLVVLMALGGSYLWALTALALFAAPMFWSFKNADFQVVCLGLFSVRELTSFAFLIAFIAFKNRISKQPVRLASLLVGGFLCAFIPFASTGYSADRGAYHFIAFVPISLILYLAYLRTSRYRIHYAASSALGALAGVLLLNMLTRGNLPAFIKHTYLIEPRYFGLLNGFIFPVKHFRWDGVLILVAANAFWVTLKLVQELRAGKGIRDFADKYFPEFALLILSVLVSSSGVARPDWIHMATGAVPSYMLTAVILSKHYLPRLFPGTAVRTGYACILAIGLLGWSVYGIHQASSEGLVGENFPLSVSDVELVPANYWPTVEFLKESLAADESFFTLTSEGVWYYLVDKPCPTRFSDVFYAATDFYQREMVEDLKRNKVKFIIYNNDCWTNLIDGIPTEARLPIVLDYINKNYEFITLVDDNEIWRIKERSR